MISQLLPAIRATVLVTILLGIIFPIAMTLICAIAFPHQAEGSLIRNASGEVIGSELLAQSFNKPEYFHARPSAAGKGYAGEASGGTNLGPTSQKLIDAVVETAVQFRKENALADSAKVPIDAATKSGSGLDPDISVQNARLQANRVALARGIPTERVQSLVTERTASRTIGIFGEPRVNVLMLNLAIDELGNKP